MNGTHRPNGIWLADGPDLGEAPSHLERVAPALLHALDVAWTPPSDADGSAGHDYTPEEEGRALARLRALGYLE